MRRVVRVGWPHAQVFLLKNLRLGGGGQDDRTNMEHQVYADKEKKKSRRNSDIDFFFFFLFFSFLLLLLLLLLFLFFSLFLISKTSRSYCFSLSPPRRAWLSIVALRLLRLLRLPRFPKLPRLPRLG